MNWMRTCQECGHKNQNCPPPRLYKEITEAFKMRKCKKCKSESLDYGQNLDFVNEHQTLTEEN